MKTLEEALNKRYPGIKFNFKNDVDKNTFQPKISICIGERKLAEMPVELLQDLSAFHGIDMEAEIVNILAGELEKDKIFKRSLKYKKYKDGKRL